MNNNLISNIARHFLYSALNHDYQSGLGIVKLIEAFSPTQIAEFLINLGENLDYLFTILDSEIPEYSSVKAYTIAQLQSPDEFDLMEKYD